MASGNLIGMSYPWWLVEQHSKVFGRWGSLSPHAKFSELIWTMNLPVGMDDGEIGGGGELHPSRILP
jgi:hypothetical protein